MTVWWQEKFIISVVLLFLVWKGKRWKPSEGKENVVEQQLELNLINKAVNC